MYELIINFMGEASIMETGLSLERCNAVVNFLYENMFRETVRLTCELST